MYLAKVEEECYTLYLSIKICIATHTWFFFICICIATHTWFFFICNYEQKVTT